MIKDWKLLEEEHPRKYDEYIVTEFFPRISTHAWWFNKDQCFRDASNMKLNVIAWTYMPKPYYYEYERICTDNI